MSKSQSKHAIEGRKWRVNAREKRRLNTVVTEYVRLKHKDIYNECKQFYDSVVEDYSHNQNLTKTQEFRWMMKKYVNLEEQIPEKPAVSNDQTENTNFPTVSTDNQSDVIQTEASAAVIEEDNVAIAESYVEDGFMMNRYVVETEKPDVIHDTIDPLASIIRDTIGDIQHNEILYDEENVEGIVNEIIVGLEEAEPNIFDEPEQQQQQHQQPEDEGIELNFEHELEVKLTDFDIDEDMYDF